MNRKGNTQQTDQHVSAGRNLVGGDGLVGEDKQQEGLRDGPGRGLPPQPRVEHATASETAQRGADVRPQTEGGQPGFPEGLYRERQSPMSPPRGRKTDMPSNAPWKPDPNG